MNAIAPHLSIIIATYNRDDVLARTLAALWKQDLAPHRCEIVVVDDGSTDDTPAILERWATGKGVTTTQDAGTAPALQVLRQPHNRGAAAARNRGIRAAQGEILLFLGDDIIAPTGFAKAHLAAHRRWPEPEAAVAGPVHWHPALRQTPTMRFVQRHAFAYPDVTEPVEADAGLFYTCNTSVKRRFLLTGPLFDEAFARRDFEDVELGHRLAQHGMRLFFVPAAWAYHDHSQDLHTLTRRWQAMGANSLLYEELTGQRAPPSRPWIRRGKVLLGQLFAPILQEIALFLDRHNWALLPDQAYRYLARYYIALGRDEARQRGRTHGNGFPDHA
jgi:GT2 family glycosyltransferase